MRYLKSTAGLGAIVFVFTMLIISSTVRAQSTILNIPATDIVAKKKVYLEFDFITHLEGYSNGGFKTFVPRTVVGLGGKFEAGVNVSFTKSGVPNPIEVQPNVKYQAYYNEKKGVAVATGAILYAPVTKRAGTNTFGMLYSNVSKQVKGTYGPRFTGGGYALVNRVSGTGAKAGVMAAYEQPLTPKIKFVTDWFSGRNRFGYVTPGLAFSTSSSSTFYVNYSIGNSGRKNNALYIYWGITL